MKQLISSLAALVVRNCRLFHVITRSNLLLEDDLTGLVVVSLCLVVGSEEELLENLSDEVLLLNDPITDKLVSFVNDLSSQSDQACDETLLLSSQLLRFDFVLVGVGGLLHLHLLLGLDLVDDLIEQVFGVIDATRVFCSSHQFVSVGLHVDQACEQVEELSARLVLNLAEVSSEDS